MALSATCGPEVLKDLINILGLKEPVDGNSPSISRFFSLFHTEWSPIDADEQGTAYFSSPLYRKNLLYRVLPKPDKAADHLEAIKDYILENHPNDSGIIYCFSVKVLHPFIWLDRGTYLLTYDSGQWDCGGEAQGDQ